MRIIRAESLVLNEKKTLITNKIMSNINNSTPLTYDKYEFNCIGFNANQKKESISKLKLGLAALATSLFLATGLNGCVEKNSEITSTNDNQSIRIENIDLQPMAPDEIKQINEKATDGKSAIEVPDSIKKKLKGLNPDAAQKAIDLYLACKDKGINIKIISGYRSFDEQEKLYAQGRTTPGPIVTNARGGQSNHNSGKAFDIAIIGKNGEIEWESPEYSNAGKIGESLGLSWGGNWKTFKDEPHFETP